MNLPAALTGSLLPHDDERQEYQYTVQIILHIPVYNRRLLLITHTDGS